MKTIRVDVKSQDERYLKIVWNADTPFRPYSISRNAVKQASNKIREVLKDLVRAALDGKLDTSGGAILKDLARAGAALYETLFTATDGKEIADRVRSFYTKNPPDRLRFSVETSVYAPWGLVYPADPDAVAQLPVTEGLSDDLGPFENFWCISRGLSTVYDRIQPDAVGDASSLGIMRVINPTVFKNVTANIDCPSEVALLQWLDVAAPPVVTLKDLRSAWKGRGAATGLLYFYCHANATMLELGEEEHVESYELRNALGSVIRDTNTSGCLLMMNGCSTAVGDPKGDFMDAASMEGLCGFVGTETDVPDRFALRFSLALVDLLFRQELTLSEAMLRLYRSHFPLSLVYGLYAHPDFRMPKPGMPDWPKPANFSREPVGSGSLYGAL